jgi:hypothetical protein
MCAVKARECPQDSESLERWIKYRAIGSFLCVVALVVLHSIGEVMYWRIITATTAICMIPATVYLSHVLWYVNRFVHPTTKLNARSYWIFMVIVLIAPSVLNAVEALRS